MIMLIKEGDDVGDDVEGDEVVVGSIEGDEGVVVEVVKALNREREKLTHFRSNGEDASQVQKHQLYYIWFSLCI